MTHPATFTDDATAWQIVDACPVLHLSWIGADGLPDVRTLHAARVGESIYLHGAPVGEKTGALDAAVTAVGHEVVAHIPSHFLDPERACPATTWFRSVHMRGVLRLETDPDRRAAALDALMRALQPEGGYTPITADDPLYRGVLRKLLVARIDVDHISGRSKMGQHRPSQVPKVLAGLWARGGPGDLDAFERIRLAMPGAELPASLSHPTMSLHVRPSPDDRTRALALLHPTYWNAHLPTEVVDRGWDDAPAWIGARAPDGRLIGTASAMSDGRRAWISDVIVDPDWRGRGVGATLMKAILDHPHLRRCIAIGLRTRDGQPFYRRLGFRARSARAYATDEMWLNRDP